MDNSYFMNGCVIWFKWFFTKLKFDVFHSDKKFVLGYLASIKNSTFGKYNMVYKNTRLLHVNMDDYSYVSKNSEVIYTNIGKFTSIGPGVKCGLGIHPSSRFVSTHPIFYSTRKQVPITLVSKNQMDEFRITEIGNDVWIGANVIIRDGIKIGDGCIIAAGAVVSSDMEPYTIAGGVPAKPIKKRFTEEEIDYLLKIQWWNKDLKWLEKNKDLFLDIERFKNSAGI